MDYLGDYRRRCDPAPATYYRRFVLLRRFLRWRSHRDGTPDPFLDLPAPRKPREEQDWLTRDEFALMLDAAAHPRRNLRGLAERDRLVLLTLVLTGVRRAELIAPCWEELDLDGELPSMLVRRGKGAKARRQPLPAQLVTELRAWRAERDPNPKDPVFCGLRGRQLSETILANIIARTSRKAGLSKHVTAHTLRHTAATWLQQTTGDPRLVAEYLGHADLSTVSRYAHVAHATLHAAVQAMADRTELTETITTLPAASPAVDAAESQPLAA